MMPLVAWRLPCQVFKSHKLQLVGIAKTDSSGTSAFTNLTLNLQGLCYGLYAPVSNSDIRVPHDDTLQR